MFIPSNFVTNDTKTRGLIKLGLMGAPGSGKSTAAATFPNTLYVDFDNKMPRIDGLKSLPFWNTDWCKEECKKLTIPLPGVSTGKPNDINRKELFRAWLGRNGVLFKPEQTLVVDSWSGLQDCFDYQTRTYEKKFNSKAEEDKFKFWGDKIEYASETSQLLKNANCNVVTIFHETTERDDEGRPVGVLPLMQGKFADRLQSFYTDWFRQIATQDVKVVGGKEIASKTEYVWQIRPGKKCNCSTTLKTELSEVPASYESFLKY